MRTASSNLTAHLAGEVTSLAICWKLTLVGGTVMGFLPSGITQEAATFTDTQAVIKVSGGVLGETYRITNRITTSAGETVDQSIDIEIIEK